MFPMLKYSEKHTRNLVLLAVFTICCSLGIANYASTIVIPATNHADIRNPALMRSGHLDQKTDFSHSENLADEEDGGGVARKKGEGDNNKGREEDMVHECMVCHKGAAFFPRGHTFCRLCSCELRVSRGNCRLCIV